MTDLATAALTADQLRQRLDDAVFCLNLSQTAEQRARWMEQIKQLQQEQRRRTEHVG